jgi:hypothetical protein
MRTNGVSHVIRYRANFSGSSNVPETAPELIRATASTNSSSNSSNNVPTTYQQTTHHESNKCLS